MRLHENQLKLIRHLARFNLLDYASCLHMLDTEGTEDKVALSYAFRPLTKNKYLTKRKDGSADGGTRHPRCCENTKVTGASIYSVGLLAEHCSGDSVHHPLYRDGAGRKREAGRL